ncbi:TATA box-binding protein-associated factor RNA polymerase I subunit B isoform X1 [Pogonomyrmex barbatus]|uniref:TATA box-binding protein-associated factor RNA polymerase I subunit B isoform X1 n=1 Tax=Pogonomyrmex barbatus TaxID=144034 RepID=A0A6I9WMQ8_9HYME|nr:TATA box-binding protein-associated factor RNA polymerase I subunit B isoform X1 [Pogonomyrmex barbatus]
MVKCRICGCSDFYKASGYFFCTTCQTQSQDVGEEVELELPIENTVRLRKTKIHRMTNNKADEELGWTSWELYNFVLIGLTNELIELGVSSDIKITVLQLWARYLGKLEVAFISAKKKLIPKLARRYKKRDAEIIYGKVLSQKSARKRKKIGSSIADSTASTYPSQETSLRELNRNKKLMITADYDRFMSQTSFEGDALSTFSQSVYSGYSSSGQSRESTRLQFNSSAKEEANRIKNMAKKLSRQKRNKYKQSHITTRYKTGPELITPTKLWAILYLALRIHNQDIHLSDMIRYGREGHLSYYRLDHLIPPEVTLTRNDINFLSRAMDISHKGMRRIIGQMAKFLGVTKIICPDFLSLINRYCIELALPKGISLYARRLSILSPPKMKFDKKSYIPNYEGRAMAFIIVVLKTLLSLDGITENEISNVADKINSAINDEGICDAKLFSFREWQKYIECRRAVLINVHCPTKLKYNANIPDVNSLYIKFLEFISTKTDREEPEKITHKHVIPHELVYAMKQCITNVSCINLPLNEVNEFSPTLTPYHSYLQQLLEHPLYDSPRMLRNDFSSVKSGYLTRPESTCKLTSQYDMQLELVDSNLHFIEKIVSLFEQAKMVSVKDLKDDVVIQDFMEEDMEEECDNRKEDFTDYLHKKIPCQLKIDMKKKQNCNHIHNTITDMQTPSVSASANEFAFDQILPDGKLSIPDRCLNDDNDGDDDDDNACLKDIVSEQTRLLLSKFCKVYNIDLSRTEKRKIFKNFNWSKKRKRKLLRNAHGKFIKRSDIYSSIESPNEDDYEESYAEETEESIGILANTFEIENIPEISRDILNSSEVNASIFDTVVEIESECGMNDKSDKFCKIFESMIDKSFTTDRTLDDNILKLFRPFKDYWMYHCNFSRVKPKNFELLEKMLPRSFRWLLNECANIIEMSTEDLYEEVCLVEAYYAYALEQSKIHAINVTNKTENCNRQAHINIILSKW